MVNIAVYKFLILAEAWKKFSAALRRANPREREERHDGEAAGAGDELSAR